MHIPTGLLASVVACKNGVKRAHLVSAYIDGGLILELYSRDGVGTMISSDFYEVTVPPLFHSVSMACICASHCACTLHFLLCLRLCTCCFGLTIGMKGPKSRPPGAWCGEEESALAVLRQLSVLVVCTGHSAGKAVGSEGDRGTAGTTGARWHHQAPLQEGPLVRHPLLHHRRARVQGAALCHSLQDGKNKGREKRHICH